MARALAKPRAKRQCGAGAGGNSNRKGSEMVIVFPELSNRVTRILHSPKSMRAQFGKSKSLSNSQNLSFPFSFAIMALR